MSEKEQPKTRWKAKALALSDEYAPDNIVVENDPELEIKELCRSVDLETEGEHASKKPKQPYGIPINPKLAIALIADLQYRIQQFLTVFDNLKFQSKLENFSVEDFDWLKDLLIRSSAITIDKSVLLKTISQPGCEGVRFYLCRKVVRENEESEKSEVVTPYLSLVTVGVDARGTDLHYVYEKEGLRKGLVHADLKNISLISEYGSPPPPDTPPTPPEENFNVFDERFVIYKYAMDEVVNINTLKRRSDLKE